MDEKDGIFGTQPSQTEQIPESDERGAGADGIAQTGDAEQPGDTAQPGEKEGWEDGVRRTAPPRKKTDLIITVDYLKTLCFAMQQRDVSLFHSVSVLNNSGEALKDVRLKLSSSPKFFEDIFLSAASAAAGEQLYFRDIRPVLDFEYLAGLTEKVKADIVIESEVGGEPVRTDVKKTDILAFDEWPGSGAYPELLACFSTPRDPAVKAVVAEAAQLLKSEGYSFNAYQSGDPNVVNRQLAALYAVVKSRNIAYAVHPASFEKQGQKIRLPQSVLAAGVGNCLETTMLLCACAEEVGINPVVFIFSGHAFPGFWLTEHTFPECVNDDLSEVKKRMAGGMSQLTALESTMLTTSSASYEDAHRHAKGAIDKGDGFILYIDIARVRRSGVLPLPIRYGENGTYTVDRELYRAERQRTENLRVVDPSTTGHGIGGRLEKWKRDLLDITLRNPLISYRLGKAGVTLMHGGLEQLEDAFAEGAVLSVCPRPGELKAEGLCQPPADQRAQDILTAEMHGKRLRTALGEDELFKRLTTMYRSARLFTEESGASPLYIALGFLKWQEAEKPSVDRFSPILLMPVEMTRRSARSDYALRMADDEMQVNLSLVEMLRINFKLDASAMLELTAGEKGVDVERSMTLMRKLIIGRKGWDVVESAALGLFHFSSFVLWNDLKLRDEKVRSHPLTGSLISGVNDPRLMAGSEEEALRLYLPVDSDSTQTKAAAEAAMGKTFVLHGPPGSGKSQTITNIIGNALAHGKKVLFVAEKMAALSVVKARLEKLGLFDFCLELHSNKGQKKDFFEQFDKVLELAAAAKDVQYAAAESKLNLCAGELDAFTEAMHRVRDAGVSVFGGIGLALEAGERVGGEVYTVAHTAIGKDAFEDGLEALRRLADMAKAVDEPSGAVFYGCEAADYTFDLKQRMQQAAGKVSAAYPLYGEAAKRLGAVCGLGGTLNYAAAAKIVRALGEALYFSGKGGFARLMHALFGKRLRAAKKLPYYRALFAFCKKERDTAVALYGQLTAFIDAEKELNAALLYGQRFEAFEDWGFELFGFAEAAELAAPSLNDYCAYNAARKEAGRFPQLAEAVRLLHAGEVKSGDTVPLLIASFWQSWVTEKVSRDPLLCRFSPNARESLRERFCTLTAFVRDLTRQEIYLKMACNLPNFAYASMSSSEPGLLLKAVKSRGRGITIRGLFERIPALISRVKPCMLMSPLSAAQYLPASFPEFDLVVFDEASQLLTCAAAGAVSRGRAVVMVGDPKQLPPTTFFAARQDEEDAELESQDLESILDDMLTLGLPENKLLWHYRSDHESLISFSNLNYYDNRLITFPAPDDAESRVTFRKVDGVYDRGGTRTNRMEAEAVVGELFDCLNHPEHGKLSYGIVTFNQAQQSLIEDLIDKRLAKETGLEQHFTRTDSPVFVKNIENVQGDERDVIFFSVTYGMDKDGRMTVNFGPVNKDGGWRRLNVAVTRAKKRIVLFSTVTPDMIDLSRTAAKGVHGLKAFMAYAMDSRTCFRPAESGKGENALTRSIAAALTDAGYTAVADLGRSLNKIDVAVTGGGACRLGILCDTDYAANSGDVRDREYGRESVLRRMGWTLTRVYAVEWWQSTASELARLKDILEGRADAAEAGGEKNADGEGSPEIEALKSAHREVAYDPSIVLPEVPYTVAGLAVSDASDSFYLYGNAAAISAQVAEIIKTEAPVPERFVYKKIADAWGISRMTQKFNEALAAIIARVPHFANNSQNVRFLWAGRDDTDMKAYRSNAEVKRAPEDICKEEFAVAAYYILQNAMSISSDDLIRETARLFGLGRTPTAAARIGYALSLLASQGKVIKEGATYKLKQ